MEIAFESKELRDMCESELEAKRYFGEAIAEMLRHRLADLDAAPSAKDIIAGRPRVAEDAETMMVDLCEGSRLVFAANHPSNPTSANGELDWGNVRRIRILRIENDRA